MIYKYFAIFEQDEENGYNVTFPDIFGGVTCGDTFEEAMFMAKDLLKMMLTTAKEQCSEPLSKQKMENLFPNKNIIEVKVDI